MSNVSLIDGHIDDDVVTTKTLTDEQIIKAIERCIGKDFTALWYVETLDQRTPISMRDILRVISNQKAEIDELTEKLECLLCHATGNKLSKSTYSLRTMEVAVNDEVQKCCEEAKAEAVKEFVNEILSPYAGKAYLNKRDLEIIVENLAKYY